MAKKIIIYALVVALFVPAVVFGAEKINGVSGYSTADAYADAASENEQVYYDDELEIKLDEAIARLDNAASDEAIEIGLSEILSFVTSMYSSAKTQQRYQKLLELGDKINKVLDKINNIENALYNIVTQLKLKEYTQRIDDRHALIGTLNNHSRPVLDSIYNAVKDKDGNIPENWLDTNYQKIYDDYLASWANASIEGTVCYTQVINFLTNVAAGQIGTDNKTLPEIYDVYAYKIYPWEHLGYEFREQQRLVDLIAAVENAALLDIYYDCMNRIKGEETYAAMQKKLAEAINTYKTTCEKVPVTKNDTKRICQIMGLEGKTFAVSVDYLDLHSSIRSACQDGGFSAILEPYFDANKRLLDNAFNSVKVYKDAAKTTAAESYSGNYVYQQKETYEKLWNYYKQRKESGKGSISGQTYNNLTEALSLHGFSGFEKSNNCYFATEKSENYRVWGDFTTNNVYYRSFQLEIRTWKKRRDTIWIWVVGNNGEYLKGTLITDCNFKNSERMDSPGNNFGNNFMSLREIK